MMDDTPDLFDFPPAREKVPGAGETVILIDAFSQIFRAFYAIRHLTNSRGEPVNALFVFTRLLLTIEHEWPSRFGAMLFDRGKVAFRLELAPEYKANRPPMPEELRSQMPAIEQMADAFGWPRIGADGYEADDLIGGFAGAVSGNVRVITSDKDLSALVDDRVKLLVPASGGGFQERDAADVATKFGVPPALIPDYLALVGDSSDNIAGVPGIGPKTAAALLSKFGPVAGWREKADELAESKYAKKLAGQEALLERNLALVSLRCELPCEFADPGTLLLRRSPDWDEIARLCRDNNFKTLLKELPGSPSEAELF